jgi:sec-independent protein translocase protein TatB
MFGIEWGEFVVIGVVALIVIGPKELPAVLRAVGQWTTKIRRMAAEFQSQFQEAMREAEMADLKKEVDNLNDVAKGITPEFAAPGATKWEPKDGLLQQTIDTAAYPADASAAPVESPAPQAVTADGYEPHQDGLESPEAAPASTPSAVSSLPGQQAATAEPIATKPSPPATTPGVTEQAPPSAVDTAPIAGATAHDP